MLTVIRKFTDYDDSLIKMHWAVNSSNAIGAMMVPPREGAAVRARAQKLKLPPKRPGCRTYGERNGNFRTGQYGKYTRDKRTGAIPADRIPVLAADFMRWREARGA